MALPGRPIWSPVGPMIPNNSYAPLGARVAGVPAPGHLTRGPNGAPKEPPFRRVTPGSRGPLRGSPWSVRGHLGLSELAIST